jgi:hypothetical protein
MDMKDATEDAMDMHHKEDAMDMHCGVSRLGVWHNSNQCAANPKNGSRLHGLQSIATVMHVLATLSPESPLWTTEFFHWIV